MTMQRYAIPEFGLDKLRLESVPLPEPGPGEVRVKVRAISLNYRDLMVIRGHYNPRLPLPATPLSDGAGEISAIGAGVTEWQVGDRVMSHFVAGWQDGDFRAAYLATTLGTPGPGMAAEQVVLPASAVVAMPEGWDFAQAATLPIAALTAWSALVTVGKVGDGSTVVTLGTGGVSIFAVQLGQALGAKVIVTSSSDEKLERAKSLGAHAGVNYVAEPAWHKKIAELTDGAGADLVVENGGVGTLSTSLKAVRGGGTVALLGALTGLRGEVDIAPLVMRRLRVEGVMVDSRRAFAELVRFVEGKAIEPVIDARFGFPGLVAALERLAAGQHFGKIVVEV